MQCAIYTTTKHTHTHTNFQIPEKFSFTIWNVHFIFFFSILGKWPNTYAFTKALSEDLIRMNGKNLPVGMFRPAIVTSSVREPVIGYIDNLYGPTGVVAGAGTGVLRTMHCNPDITANIVPVDMTVNALIASAWDVATNYKDAWLVRFHSFFHAL